MTDYDYDDYDYDRDQSCAECGEPATLVVPEDPEGDDATFWCEECGIDRIDARPMRRAR